MQHDQCLGSTKKPAIGLHEGMSFSKGRCYAKVAVAWLRLSAVAIDYIHHVLIANDTSNMTRMMLLHGPRDCAPG